MQKQLMQWDAGKTKFLVYTFIGLYLLLFLPFWQPVLLGFLFACACAPIVNMVRVRLHTKRTGVAYATVALALIFFIGLTTLVLLQGYSQVYDLFKNPETMGQLNQKVAGFRDQFLNWTDQQSYLQSLNIRGRLDGVVEGVTNSAQSIGLAVASGFVQRTPAILLDLAIFITAFAALLVIQPRIWETITQALGLGEKGKEHFKRFEKICGLALGSVLLTGFVQSLLVMIGAAIAGYDSLLMILGITFLFALIPVLGAGLVPAILTLAAFFQGDMKSAIIMLVTAVIVGVADNILRAWLFSRAAKTNPAISIITLLGGIALFGFPGLFIAPVIEQLVMTYAFSGEGEPQPNQVTASQDPIPAEAFVDHSDDKNSHKMVPRPT